MDLCQRTGRTVGKDKHDWKWQVSADSMNPECSDVYVVASLWYPRLDYEDGQVGHADPEVSLCDTWLLATWLDVTVYSLSTLSMNVLISSPVALS